MKSSSLVKPLVDFTKSVNYLGRRDSLSELPACCTGNSRDMALMSPQGCCNGLFSDVAAHVTDVLVSHMDVLIYSLS